MNYFKRIYNLNFTNFSNNVLFASNTNEIYSSNCIFAKSFSSLSKKSSMLMKNEFQLTGAASYSSKDFNTLRNDMLVINEEVREALNSKKPVVALESAIITHGMPYPTNIDTALHLEDILRKMNCVPATIGFVKGKLVVGLSQSEIEMIAEPKYETVKISSRDLPIAIAKKKCGGTTVAATLVACRMAGISVFVTGGVGGVHRPAKVGGVSWDVSADLIELGRSPGIAVVCAGVKSILDVAATLEYMETQGITVTVLTEDSTEEPVQFPDFFSRESGVMAPSTAPTIDTAAEMLLAAQVLELNGALVLAVPTPMEHALAGHKIKEAICESLDEAEKRGVRGCAVTPSVLAKLAKLTKGTSVSANKALIANNVMAGGRLAMSFAKIKHSISSRTSHQTPRKMDTSQHPVG